MYFSFSGMHWAGREQVLHGQRLVKFQGYVRFFPFVPVLYLIRNNYLFQQGDDIDGNSLLAPDKAHAFCRRCLDVNFVDPGI